ncbi:MAG: hypothetical protein WCB44_10950, partial [Stellaceae bacterium]
RLTQPFRPQTNSLPPRRRGAWSSVSTAASASILPGCRKTAPPAAAQRDGETGKGFCDLP